MNKIKKFRILEVIIAFIIITLLNINVYTGSQITEGSFNKLLKAGFNIEYFSENTASYCECAERINWIGACRGKTIRLCKGEETCPCGDEEQEE